jgi:RNA polymerase sigma factor (TIGR02999 family)
MAGAMMRGQSAAHTLQPTALVHEAYLKLVRAPDTSWQNKAHFCAVAATAMRQILINHARRRAAAQRARDEKEARKTRLLSPSNHTTVDLLALDESLTKLAALDERQAQLVELRFFGGMTNEQVAGVLQVSTSTIEKQWRRVRAWLIDELREEGVA